MAIPVRLFIAFIAAAATAGSLAAQAQESFRFRSGVELVNVTATVTDRTGRFVAGLSKEDFIVYEDDARQEISHFSNERVPVSLGIALDTSGSMTPDKMAAARAAIDRFVLDLLGDEDELFFMQFASSADLVQGWTTDRRAISRAVHRANAGGGTAMYDAIAKALPIANRGRNSKKALLVITDGNDNSSSIGRPALQRLIRESEVLVYALGVDGTASRRSAPVVQPPTPLPFPIPWPGRRQPGRLPPFPQVSGTWSRGADDRVNEQALRQITDQSGGRTEIVRGFGGLEEATRRIADELSRQYYLGYTMQGEKDGRWRAIRVEVRDGRLNVRARQGYFAS